MATQIVRIGGSIAVEVPEELLRQANLEIGDSVDRQDAVVSIPDPSEVP